jgi:hypothetical protein
MGASKGDSGSDFAGQDRISRRKCNTLTTGGLAGGMPITL